MTIDELAALIQRSLKRSRAVELDGLGVFARNRSGKISLHPLNRIRVFIAYARENAAEADRLYEALLDHGFAPWMDRRKLLPGQNWPRRIEDAIYNSDYFIACFSKESVQKKGGFQAELRYALDCARRVPLDDVFLIPLRLDDCRVPTRIQRETQYVDMFPEWDAGFEKVVEILGRRRRRVA
jgi:hypothetical protein